MVSKQLYQPLPSVLSTDVMSWAKSRSIFWKPELLFGFCKTQGDNGVQEEGFVSSQATLSYLPVFVCVCA